MHVVSKESVTWLCASSSDPGARLRDVLWSSNHAVVLTSGTLAVNGSFQRFRDSSGLSEHLTVLESIFPSPYDYENNCLLYLPQVPPREEGKKSVYYNALSADTVRLLTAAHGHALILFTSYAAMSRIIRRLGLQKLSYLLFSLERNSGQILEKFRGAPRAVRRLGGDGLSGRLCVPAHYPQAAFCLPRREAGARAGALSVSIGFYPGPW